MFTKISFLLCGVAAFAFGETHAPNDITGRNTAACTTFLIGNETPMPFPEYVSDVSFSTDGKYLIYETGDFLVVVSWPERKPVARIRHNAEIKAREFSPGNRYLGSGDNGGSGDRGPGGVFNLTEMHSGKNVISDKTFNRVTSITFSKNGNKAIVTGIPKVVIYDTQTGRVIKELPTEKWVYGAKFSADESRIIISEEGGIKEWNPETSATRDIAIQAPLAHPGGTLSPNGETLLVRLKTGDVGLVDVKSGTLKWQVDIKTVNARSSFLPDGSILVESSPSDQLGADNLYEHPGKFMVLDAERGKPKLEAPIVSFVNDLLVSPKGDRVATVYPHVPWRIYNLQTGKELPFGARLSMATGGVFAPDGEAFLLEGNGAVTMHPLDTACVDAVSVQKGDLVSALPADIRALCERPFDAKAWDAQTVLPVVQPLSLAQQAVFLSRFQKPGGIDVRKHLPILISLLDDKDFVKKYPNEVKSILENLLKDSNLLYQDLITKFPHLKRLPDTAENTALYCRSAKDEDQAQAASASYLTKLVELQGGRTIYSDWDKLRPLNRRLAKLDESQKNRLIDKITNSLADAAADEKDFVGIFHSKLYYFAREAINPIFGIKSSAMTDVTIVRNRDSLDPKIMGVERIDGDPATETKYGFFMKVLPSVSLAEYRNLPPGQLDLNGREKIDWTHGGKKFFGNLQVSSLDAKKVFLPEGKMPYEELWKDKKLTGLVMTGTNLKGLARPVMEEYLAYYKDEGFKFAEPKKIEDVGRYFENKVKSGELDYLVKEAHSDGDEKNLFRYDRGAYEVVGTKKLKDGREEVVHLTYPDEKEKRTELLSNHQFGEWIRERESSGAGPLVYFNTSCWSCNKAVNEIEAARSKLLIDIPATTMVNTFSNWRTNAERLLFQAFREGKSYEQMREDLKGNEEYKKGKGNYFIFPDDDDYKKSIVELLAWPLDIRTRVVDSSGNVLNIDELH